MNSSGMGVKFNNSAEIHYTNKSWCYLDPIICDGTECGIDVQRSMDLNSRPRLSKETTKRAVYGCSCAQLKAEVSVNGMGSDNRG